MVKRLSVRESVAVSESEAKYSFYFDEVTMIGRKAGRRGTYDMNCFRINYYYV